MPVKALATASAVQLATTSTTTTTSIKVPLKGQVATPGDNLGFLLEGTDANDTIWGSAGNDGIYGFAGNDVLYGQDGNDLIFGGEGNDALYGGAGIDQLDGGNGNDFLHGGAGADKLTGGLGTDTVSYANSSSVTVQLGYQGFAGDAQGDTYSGIENVIGSGFNDSLIGDGGNNTLNGGGGNDQITGGAGRDVLIGGAGQDILTGDTAGVWENDVFVIQRNSGFDSPPGWQAYDTITDFQNGYDKIMLSGYSAADLGSDGKLAHGVLYEDGIIRFTGNMDASDRLYYDDMGALFECEIVMQNGEAHLVSSTEIARLGFGTYVGTDDLLFA